MKHQRGRRGAGALLIALPLAACATDQAHRATFASGDFAAAERKVKQTLAAENDVELAVVEQDPLHASIDRNGRDTCLHLLDLAVCRLAQDDPETAALLLREADPVLKKRVPTTWLGYMGASTPDEMMRSIAAGDAALDFQPADYEYLMVPVVQALCELLSPPAKDALPTLRVFLDRQDELAKAGWVEDAERDPRRQYERMAIGSYLMGVVEEAQSGSRGDARFWYRQANTHSAADKGLIQAAFERVEERLPRCAAGEGVLHVVHFAGTGPDLVPETVAATEGARALALILAAVFQRELPAAAFQKPVEIPVVRPSTGSIPPLTVSVSGGGQAATEVLLDVNEVARQQAQANLDLTLARALVRRGLKAGAGGAVENNVRDENAGKALSIGWNLLSTAGETVDTRTWSTLPAGFGVARLPLAAGVHDVAFGDGSFTRVEIQDDRDTFVLVIQPDLARPGTVLVDRWSRPAE